MKHGGANSHDQHVWHNSGELNRSASVTVEKHYQNLQNRWFAGSRMKKQKTQHKRLSSDSEIMYDLVVTRTRRSITERVRKEQNIKRYRGNIERASHLGAERHHSQTALSCEGVCRPLNYFCDLRALVLLFGVSVLVMLRVNPPM